MTRLGIICNRVALVAFAVTTYEASGPQKTHQRSCFYMRNSLGDSVIRAVRGATKCTRMFGVDSKACEPNETDEYRERIGPHG